MRDVGLGVTHRIRDIGDRRYVLLRSLILVVADHAAYEGTTRKMHWRTAVADRRLRIETLSIRYPRRFPTRY